MGENCGRQSLLIAGTGPLVRLPGGPSGKEPA